MRSNSGETSRNSTLIGWPVLTLVSTPFLTSQPASLSSCTAWRRLPRMKSGVSLTGLLVHFGEHFRRHAVLHLVQDLELATFGRRQRRGQLAALEIAADPRILAVEQILVGPLEVEGEIERLPHAPVLELRPPQIEHEALHRLRPLDRHLLALDEAVTHRGEVVGRGPVLGARLLPIIETAGLEAFERDGLVAVILEADLVVVPLAPVDRAGRCPNSP